MNNHKGYKSYEEAGITNIPYTSKDTINVTCPSCSADRKKAKLKCLNINLRNKAFRCAHCDFGGRILDQIDYSERRQQFEPKQYALPQRPANPKLSQPSIEWFEQERFISEATLNHFGVYSGKMWHRAEEKEVGAVCIPYIRNGNLVNIKKRSRDKMFTHEKGAELCLYNIDSLQGQREAVITEGELGALLWHEAGWTGGLVSVPNGVNLSKEEKAFYEKNGYFPRDIVVPMEYIDSAWNELVHIETFYIAVDDDVAGRKLRQELIRRLGAERCKVVTFRGEKDEGDLVKRTGNRFGLLNQLHEAVDVPVEGVYDANSVWDKMLDLYENGRPRGSSLGIEDFEGHYASRLGELDILTGLPNDGKTTFLMWLMSLMSVKLGYKWAIYCPESITADEFLHLMVQIILGQSADRKAGPRRMSKAKYNSARRFMQEHFYIIDPESIHKLDDVIERCELLVRRKGINACLVDPWNDIIPVFNPGEREDQYLQRQLSAIRKFKDRNQVKFFINAHPTNLKWKEGEKPPVAKASDISGGGMWNARADNIWCYYRHRDENGNIDKEWAEIHIHKVKHQDLVGKPTYMDNPIMLRFDWETRRFYGKKKDQTMPNLSEDWLSHYSPEDQQLLLLEKTPEPEPVAAPTGTKGFQGTFEDEGQTLAPMTPDGRQLAQRYDFLPEGVDPNEEPPF